MPDEDLSAGLRASLEEEQRTLRAQLGEIQSDTDEGQGFDDNFADSGQVATSQMLMPKETAARIASDTRRRSVCPLSINSRSGSRT